MNNALTLVCGWLEVLRGELGENSPHLRTINVVREEAARTAELTRNLQEVARGASETPRDLDLNELLGEVTGLVRREMEKNRIVVDSQIAPDLPTVCGSAGRLKQALLNLLVNARQAMPDGGRIVLSAGREGDGRVAVVGAGHRLRHPAGTARARLPHVLHHEDRRHRPGTADHEEDRRGPWRRDPDGKRAGPRRPLHDPASGEGRTMSLPRNILVLSASLGQMELALEALAKRGVVTQCLGETYRFVAAFATEKPDMAIVDAEGFRKQDLEMLRVLREIRPQSGIVVLVNPDQRDIAAGAFCLGADFYLLKPVGRPELLEAVSRVGLGHEPPEEERRGHQTGGRSSRGSPPASRRKSTRRWRSSAAGCSCSATTTPRIPRSWTSST